MGELNDDRKRLMSHIDLNRSGHHNQSPSKSIRRHKSVDRNPLNRYQTNKSPSANNIGRDATNMEMNQSNLNDQTLSLTMFS
jgi:hypothetical protein